jgi:TRAP-type C4-dicarboxylate transport system substrate-binding protein
MGAIALLAACASPKTAAAPTVAHRVLTFAHIDNDLKADPAATWFIDDLAQRSRGALTVKFANECCGRENTAQETLVSRVGAGEFDLGWVATRGLEDTGVTAFQALTIPRLIDSYAAEAAVLASDIGTSMLPALDGKGVRALALEPGTLRRPISNGSPLREPSDWKGITFWTYKSATSAATVAALGATVSQDGNDIRDPALESGQFQGAENSVFWQGETTHVPNAVITINEALWPRTSVLIANPSVLAGLSPTQRGWIAAAAKATSTRTMDVAAMDAAAVDTVCRNGGRFASASAAQLAATSTALSPVITRLGAEPATNGLITKITALKPEVSPADEYTVPPSCEATG